MVTPSVCTPPSPVGAFLGLLCSIDLCHCSIATKSEHDDAFCTTTLDFFWPPPPPPPHLRAQFPTTLLLVLMFSKKKKKKKKVLTFIVPFTKNDHRKTIIILGLQIKSRSAKIKNGSHYFRFHWWLN